MSKLGILGAAALSLTLAVATPAFAAGVRDGGATHVDFHGAQGRVGSVVSSGAGASCAQRWMYYNAATGMAMDDGGEWRACP
jgi:hypothetical protein